MNNTYKLGSLFDGSGGFPLAGVLCDITPMWAAEVEPYPIAVTKSRFPDMKHLGDISKVNGGEIEPVDIITFGSPCQDLSVAGKRAGLKHEANGDEETTRSGLFMEAVRIIKEMRKKTDGKYPRFAVWENVPGAFSSNRGEDFRIVLEELIKIVDPNAVMPPVPKGGWAYADSYRGENWSLAYRVFDAQYIRTAQRRRRIYLVFCLTDGCAEEILFKRDGLRGYFTEGRAPWKATARNAENCPGADDRAGASGVIPINTMIATRHKQLGRGTGFGVGEAGEPQFTISAGHEHAVAYAVESVKPIRMATQQGGAEIRTDDKTPTITAAAGMSGNNHPVVALIDSIGGQAERGWTGDIAPTLKASHYKFPPSVAYSFDSLASNSMKSKNPHSGCRMVEVAKTLDTTDPNPCKNQGGIAIVEQYLFENHSQDSRYKGPLDVCPMLPAQLDTGGNNTPLVMAPVVYSGGNITSPTNAANPQPGDPCHTLDTDNRNWAVICLQGNGIDRADNAGCNGKGHTEGVSYTLNTMDRHAVAYGLDRASYNQGKNAQFDFSVLQQQQPTLTAKGPGAVSYCIGNGQVDDASCPDQELSKMLNCMHDPMAVMTVDESSEPQYIVRRLTPTECARLQGFPDWWGVPDHKDSFTDEEYKFWLNVRNTHAEINGKTVKEYTKEQMIKWYNKLHTDSAEYKMWGNGIALPCALYVMQGVKDAL